MMSIFNLLFGNKKKKEAELAYKKLEQKPRGETLYDKMGGPHRPNRYVDDYIPPYKTETEADKRMIRAQQASLDELKRRQRIEDEEEETRRRKRAHESSFSSYSTPDYGSSSITDWSPTTSSDNTDSSNSFSGFGGGDGGGAGASGDWSSNSESSSSYDSSSSSDSSSYDSGSSDSGGGDSGGSSD